MRLPRMRSALPLAFCFVSLICNARGSLVAIDDDHRDNLEHG